MVKEYKRRVKLLLTTITLCVFMSFNIQAQSDCETIQCDEQGNVRISTPFMAEGYKLSLGGKTITEGVRIMLKSQWPDYVFEEGYPLLTLPELKQFIHTNRHLPNVTPADSVKMHGIKLEETSVQLLEKVEELSLYFIQLDERLRDLEKTEE